MKQNTHRLVDLARGLQQQGQSYDAGRDSIYTVEPLTVQTVELPSPLKSADAFSFPVDSTATDSNVMTVVQAVGGAQATTQVVSNQVLDSGLWHLYGSAYFAWNVGAITAANGMSCGLTDPNGKTFVFGRVLRVPLTGVLILPIDFVISIDRNKPGSSQAGWRGITTVETTLVADTVAVRLDLLCNRLI